MNTAHARSCWENSAPAPTFHSQGRAGRRDEQPIPSSLFTNPIPFYQHFVHSPGVLGTLTAVLRPWRSGVFNMRASNTSSDSLRTYSSTAREQGSTGQHCSSVPRAMWPHGIQDSRLTESYEFPSRGLPLWGSSSLVCFGGMGSNSSVKEAPLRFRGSLGRGNTTLSGGQNRKSKQNNSSY